MVVGVGEGEGESEGGVSNQTLQTLHTNFIPSVLRCWLQ